MLGTTSTVGLKHWSRLVRPHQWLKNGFVLAGPLFAGQWAGIATSVGALFAAFCCMASAVYICNDLRDVEADRQHPSKRHRPIAAGRVGPKPACGVATLLALVGAGLAFLVSPAALFCVLAYAGVNVAYSLGLKHVVVLDVFLISAGFMLRLLAGTLGLGIPPSAWLLLTGLMLTLFLGFAKRRAELQAQGVANGSSLARPVLNDYPLQLVEQFTAICAACSILTYSLYTVAPETVVRYGGRALVATVPFVVYGIFRYLYLVHARGLGQDAALDLIRDRHLQAALLGWLALAVGLRA